MKVREAFSHIKNLLAKVDSERLETERLLAKALGCTASELFQNENIDLTPKQVQWLEEAVVRRSNGEPLAYILGTQGFYKHDFIVRPGVLIPRPETELIVEKAFHAFGKNPPALIADLGCGSGCIGISLLKEWPNAKLIAFDRSPIALEVARENAKALKVDDRCKFIEGTVESKPRREEFDLIVANPPYVDEADTRVEESVRKYEPREALFASQNGLGAIFAWSEWASIALKRGGVWIVEIGAGQSEPVKVKLDEIGFAKIDPETDLAGHVRIFSAQKPKLWH